MLAAVLGGIALYVLSRKDADGGKLASREEEAEVDVLQDVKINFAKASVAKKGAGGRSPPPAAARPTTPSSTTT